MARSNAPARADAGSPHAGEPVYLAVGYLRRPHGVRGEIIMDVLTDFPERIQPGVTYYVGEKHQPLALASRRGHAKGMLVAFEDYLDRDIAATLRNSYVYVLAADRPALPDGEFYQHELLGLRIVDEESGRPLGELVDIFETGANDVYVVRRENARDLLLPAIPDVILNVDIERGQITVHLLPGLLDAEQ